MSNSNNINHHHDHGMNNSTATRSNSNSTNITSGSSSRSSNNSQSHKNDSSALSSESAVMTVMVEETTAVEVESESPLQSGNRGGTIVTRATKAAAVSTAAGTTLGSGSCSTASAGTTEAIQPVTKRRRGGGVGVGTETTRATPNLVTPSIKKKKQSQSDLDHHSANVVTSDKAYADALGNVEDGNEPGRGIEEENDAAMTRIQASNASSPLSFKRTEQSVDDIEHAWVGTETDNHAVMNENVAIGVEQPDKSSKAVLFNREDDQAEDAVMEKQPVSESEPHNPLERNATTFVNTTISTTTTVVNTTISTTTSGSDVERPLKRRKVLAYAGAAAMACATMFASTGIVPHQTGFELHWSKPKLFGSVNGGQLLSFLLPSKSRIQVELGNPSSNEDAVPIVFPGKHDEMNTLNTQPNKQTPVSAPPATTDPTLKSLRQRSKKLMSSPKREERSNSQHLSSSREVKIASTWNVPPFLQDLFSSSTATTTTTITIVSPEAAKTKLETSPLIMPIIFDPFAAHRNVLASVVEAASVNSVQVDTDATTTEGPRAWLHILRPHQSRIDEAKGKEVALIKSSRSRVNWKQRFADKARETLTHFASATADAVAGASPIHHVMQG